MELNNINLKPNKEAQEEIITINKNKLYVMLTAALYAGHLESTGDGFIDDFGADSFQHLDEYIAFGEKYSIPKDDDGFFDTECMRYDVETWIDKQYKETENSMVSIVLPCKVGDILYEPIKGLGVFQWTVKSFYFDSRLCNNYSMDCERDDLAHWKFWKDEIGDKLFLTAEEAENKLKELNKK